MNVIFIEEINRSKIVTVSAKLSPKEFRALEEAARLCGTSKSAFIRGAIVMAITSLNNKLLKQPEDLDAEEARALLKCLDSSQNR